MATRQIGACVLGKKSTWKLISCLTLAALFCFAGIMHFRKPGFFLKAMPPWLPCHMPAVLVSGFFEILGGIGLLVPKTRRAAGIGLITLLAAVFPANIYMAMDSNKFAPIPQWGLWLRLPLQFVFMAWVNWSSKSTDKAAPTPGSDSQSDLISGDDRG